MGPARSLKAKALLLLFLCTLIPLGTVPTAYAGYGNTQHLSAWNDLPLAEQIASDTFNLGHTGSYGGGGCHVPVTEVLAWTLTQGGHYLLTVAKIQGAGGSVVFTVSGSSSGELFELHVVNSDPTQANFVVFRTASSPKITTFSRQDHYASPEMRTIVFTAIANETISVRCSTNTYDGGFLGTSNGWNPVPITNATVKAYGAFSALIDPRGFGPPIIAPNLGTTAGHRKVTLTWNNIPDARSYSVWSSTSSHTPTTPMNSSGYQYVGTFPCCSVEDVGLIAETTYFYRVLGANSFGEGPTSAERNATPYGLPGAPVGVHATAGPKAGEVSIRWDPPGSNGGTAIVGYDVLRSESAGPEIAVTHVAQASVVVDAGLSSDTIYRYRVRAVNAAGRGDPSEQVEVRTFAPPTPPQNISVALQASPPAVKLQWESPIQNSSIDGGLPISDYTIYRAAGVAPPTILTRVIPQHTSYTDTTCETGTTCSYFVTASSRAGEGRPSTLVSSPGAASAFDGYDFTLYRPESATGNTPFAGLRLKATFPGSESRQPVNMANGEAVISFSLLRLLEPFDEDLTLDLTYRSIGRDGSPFLGTHWSLNWLEHLEKNGTDLMLHTGDGRTLQYTNTSQGWVGPPGTYSVITETNGKYELRDRHGNRRVFDPAKGLALAEKRNAAGPTWQLSYDALNGTLDRLVDPLGRVTTFTYADGPESQQLVSITDPTGRRADIHHNATTGLITSISTPGPTEATSFLTQFTYDADKRLTRIRDPDDVAYVELEYDQAGRVTQQRVADGTASYFVYNHTAGITRAWDGDGNEIEWQFRAAGARESRSVPSTKIEHTRGLRPTDPQSFTTTFEHNDHEEITRIVRPSGNFIDRVYDDESPSVFARGNLLIETRLPGPVAAHPLQTTSQARIETRYTYDALCNLPVAIVDPRGTDPGFIPPNGGDTSPARYTTTIAYNTACKPILIQHPTVNPAGLPDAAFGEGFLNQDIREQFTYDSKGRLLTYTDPRGTVTLRTYFQEPSVPGRPQGYLSSEIVDSGPSPHLALTKSYEYTDFGVVAKIVDPNGNVRNFSIDERGRQVGEVGPLLSTTSASIERRTSYDRNDNILVIEQKSDSWRGGFIPTEFSYDAVGRLVREIKYPSLDDPIVTTYRYDGTGDKIQRSTGPGETHAWAYDERGLLLSVSGPDGGTFVHDGNGNLRQRTDQLGRNTTFHYDGYDRPIGYTDALGSMFITSYDPASNVVSETALGGISGVTLFERRRAHDEGNREFRSLEWLQSAASMPPAGATLGPGGRWVTTLREFDARGDLVRMIDDNRHVTAVTYDAARRLVATIDASGNVQSRGYDPNGNLVEIERWIADNSISVCPMLCRTQYAYDEENRLATTTNPDGTVRTIAYDGRGNVIWAVDEAGNLVEHTYDGADRLIATSRSLGTSPATFVITTTQWDDEGRVRSRCDDSGACTNYSYVPSTSLVASEAPPVGPSMTNTRDAVGNLQSVSWSSGKSINLEHDALDRLVRIEAGAAPQLGTTSQRFTYDDLGRITAATDNGIANLGAGIATTVAQIAAVQSFDTLGRVIFESQLGLPVSHTIDGVGNTLTTAYPSLDGRVVSRSFDANDRLDRVWDPKGLIADYESQGSLVTRKDFGGTTPHPAATGPSSPVAITSITYDGAERPASVEHRGAGGVLLAGLTTRFDTVGNRAAQKLQGTGIDAHSQLFELDALYRTISWRQGPLTDSAPGSPLDMINAPRRHASWPTINGQNDWLAWDPGSGLCTRTTGVTNVPAKRIVEDWCPASPNLSKTYSYDADGNLATDGTYLYRWDFLDRLIRVEDTSGNPVVGYGYDAFGRRVIKVFPDNDAAALGVQSDREAWYTFAGQHVLQESQPIGSTLPIGITPTAPDVHVIRQWVYGPAVDEILAMDVDAGQDGVGAIGETDERYFYAYDSGSNVLGLMSETGRLVEGYSYQPYGAVTILVPAAGATDVKWDGSDDVSTGTYGTDPSPRPYSPSGNLWFFTGRQYDPEIGLYNYRARHYHPGLGQFLSIDPIGPWGDSMSLGNPYAYVGNNPGTWTDPSGMAWWNPLNRDFAIWEAGGSALSVATGTLGSVAGGGAGLVMGQGFAGFAQGWDAGAAASPLGSLGEASRARIRADLATSAAPGYALAINDFLGPAQTTMDAAITLGLSLVPGLGAGGKAAATEARLATRPEKVVELGPAHRRTGETVLGSYPGYIEKGEQLGARYFNIPAKHFGRMSAEEQWAANTRFLDRTVARGDDVMLSNPVRSGTGSTLEMEVNYLLSNGYVYIDPLRLVVAR